MPASVALDGSLLMLSVSTVANSQRRMEPLDQATAAAGASTLPFFKAQRLLQCYMYQSGSFSMLFGHMHA